MSERQNRIKLSVPMKDLTYLLLLGGIGILRGPGKGSHYGWHYIFAGILPTMFSAFIVIAVMRYVRIERTPRRFCWISALLSVSHVQECNLPELAVNIVLMFGCLVVVEWLMNEWATQKVMRR